MKHQAKTLGFWKKNLSLKGLRLDIKIVKVLMVILSSVLVFIWLWFLGIALILKAIANILSAIFYLVMFDLDEAKYRLLEF